MTIGMCGRLALPDPSEMREILVDTNGDGFVDESENETWLAKMQQNRQEALTMLRSDSAIAQQQLLASLQADKNDPDLDSAVHRLRLLLDSLASASDRSYDPNGETAKSLDSLLSIQACS
ncbi:MAG: hypothetical protein V2A73_03195 [Pseudomonadota bacterium]